MAQDRAPEPAPLGGGPASGGAPPASGGLTALAALASELAALDPGRPGALEDALAVVAEACGLADADVVEVDLRAAPVQDADDSGGPATALAREAVRRDGLVRAPEHVAVPVEGGALVAALAGTPDGAIRAGGLDEALLAAAAVQVTLLLRRRKDVRAARAAADATSRADARLELLAGGGRLLASTLDVGDALTALARLLVPSLADWCTVHLVDPGDPRRLPRVAVHADSDERRALLDRLELLIPPTVDDVFGVGQVLRSGRPHVASSPAPGGTTPASPTSAAQVQALLDALGTRSVVDIPLPDVSSPGRPASHAGRPLGVLTLARGRDDPLTLEDVGLASELAERASLAVRNARTYREAQDAALTLQRSLLPHSLPDVPGLALAASYQPGGTSHVGGDWYDAIPLPDGSVGLVIGDVMGRGLHAAAVMGQLRAALRGYALEGHRPAEVVVRLDAVVEMLDVGFATCLYATLDPVSGDLEVAAAGHLPPLLLRADGSAELLAIDPGLPLGAGPGAPVATRLRLAPGETLVLYTDGLVESREQPVGDGLALLERRAVGLPREPDAALDGLLERLDPRSGDDTALLVVARVPSPAAEDVDVPRGAAGAVGPVAGAGPGGAGTADGAGVEVDAHDLPHGPDAPSQARAAVRAALHRWGLADDLDAATLLLLTTELVTNAVRHGVSSPRLTLERAGRGVRVSVSDSGPRRALLARDPGSGSETGRGLWLVEMMARDWGVADPAAGEGGTEPTGDRGVGKTVWFSVELSSGS